jgi:hypothetical protein
MMLFLKINRKVTSDTDYPVGNKDFFWHNGASQAVDGRQKKHFFQPFRPHLALKLAKSNNEGKKHFFSDNIQ